MIAAIKANDLVLPSVDIWLKRWFVLMAGDMRKFNSMTVAAPCFKEADLVVECRKMYWQDLDDRNFLSAKIAEKYPQMDYHRVFFGAILRIRGSREFRKK